MDPIDLSYIAWHFGRLQDDTTKGTRSEYGKEALKYLRRVAKQSGGECRQLFDLLCKAYPAASQRL